MRFFLLLMAISSFQSTLGFASGCEQYDNGIGLE
jgi:hypothetical protein